MRKYFGDKAFYKMVLMVVFPIMVQNGITNFVSLLDNIMVGQIGTEQMSGVAIVNQLIFIFNLSVFGALSGAGIFGAQYFGSGNHDYLRYTFRFKLIICTVISAIAIVLFRVWDTQLVSLYLHESETGGDLAATLDYAKDYFAVIVIGLLPFAYTQMYASTLRETGETMVPMISGVIAVVVNLVLNYILIFGHLGAPKLGVTGAAIATVTSRFVELIVLAGWTHRHAATNRFIQGAYRSLYMPRVVLKEILLKGSPLLINEVLFSIGISMQNQCYSVRGLDTVAAQNITSTVSNVFNITYMAMGSAIAIIVGQLLGAEKMEEARDTDRKLIVFALLLCGGVGIIMAAIAPFFPQLYNTTENVRSLATDFILITACCMPLFAFTNAAYFTLRSGGKTIITFLFDSCYIWIVSMPLAFILVHYTSLDIVTIYAITQAQDLIKCIIGGILLKKGIWVHNIAAV